MITSDAANTEIIDQIMKPFDLRTIEKDLRELWKQKEDAAEENKVTSTRACVSNLLIYEDQEDEINTLTETIIDVTKHHPCRVIVMSSKANSLEDKLEAGVSAICSFTISQGKQICSEQIMVKAEGSAVKRLSASVMPLLVSDLPVNLWWRGVPVDTQPFSGLLGCANRVILDSSYSTRPTAFLSVLATLARQRFKEVAFSDINWSRLTQLRSHIAGLFDVPDLLAYLKDLSKVTIEFPSSTTDQDLPAPQAMLLVGWFMSRLNWGLTEDILRSRTGATILKFLRGEHEITVEMTPSTKLENQDLKLTLTMADNTGWQEARIVIMRNYAYNAIETKLETPTICWLKDVARYEMPTESELILSELEILGHDVIYENALECTAQIIEKM
ncbi:MAG: glucose-6-phosphate dehydrogenase assembly protein OpcA [Acidobacteria bacterium]|nr:glucose-6-phosphate dehydrogenase assembly protein OpcA [Acidobacteriota bacterium]